VLTCASIWTDRLLSPAIRVVRAAPVASFILLVVLWTDKNYVPVVISVLMVIPVVWGNLSRGIRETDPQLLELARAYGFSGWRTVRLVYLPCLRPYFVSAITTATGLAWKSGVAAEVLCLPSSAMGTQIFNTKYYVEIPELFAWTAVVVTLSLLLEKLLRRVLVRKGGI
jgi:NitT/TauT family transport system permease protein